MKNARISPVTISVIIYGIIFLAAFPPVGMALLLAAWLIQRRYRSDVLRGRRHAQAARAAKAEAARYETAFRLGSL